MVHYKYQEAKRFRFTQVAALINSYLSVPDGKGVLKLLPVGAISRNKSLTPPLCFYPRGRNWITGGSQIGVDLFARSRCRET